MNETLEKITRIIEDYNSSNNHHPEGLLTMARELSSNLFFLDTYRIDIHKKYEGSIYMFVNGQEKMPVNKAVNKANFLYPEMYKLRRLMESANKSLDIIRSEISWKRSELQNTNING